MLERFLAREHPIPAPDRTRGRSARCSQRLKTETYEYLSGSNVPGVWDHEDTSRIVQRAKAECFFLL